GPFFLASWLGLALITGLGAEHWLSRASGKYGPLSWLIRALTLSLRHPAGRLPRTSLGGLLIFSFIASVPALVATFLIGREVVLIRVAAAVVFALVLHRVVISVTRHEMVNTKGKPPNVGGTTQTPSLRGDIRAAQPFWLCSFIRVTWNSFIGQVDRGVIPLLVGFVLASALIIHIPASAIRPWLGDGAWHGPYLAAILAMPLHLSGGVEVLLASALLVKGASLGTVLSVMLAAPSASYIVIRRVRQSMDMRAVAIYLVAAWLVAGSIGVVVDGIQ
ncbi:MAG: permease, partial [Dehalococcoidia bacterium]|nr:permease [Dehalococcoidia bacterium]